MNGEVSAGPKVAATLAAHVPVRSVAEALFASAASSGAAAQPWQLAVSPSEALARRSRRWPAAAAAALVASVDTAAPDAAEVLEVFLRDRRAAVRRELADLEGLPEGFARRLLATAVELEDWAAVESLVMGNEWEPAVLADLFAADLDAGMGGSTASEVARVIASDRDVAARFVSSAGHRSLVERVLAAAAANAAGPGAARFEDLVSVACTRAADPFNDQGLAKVLIERNPEALRPEVVRWLDAVVDDRSDVNWSRLSALGGIEDPERIVAWWRSDVAGRAREALLRERSPALPAVARAVVAEVSGSADPVLLARTALSMCRFETWVWEPRPLGLEGFGEVAAAALELLAEAGEADVDMVDEAFAAVAVLWEQLFVKGWFSDAAVRVLVRLGELCPAAAGPLAVTSPIGVFLGDDGGTPSGDAVALLELLGAVADDPVRFGIAAHVLTVSSTRRACPASQRATWVRLVANTPGAVREAFRPGAGEALTSAVAAALTAELVDDEAAWAAAVPLVASWEGTVLELAGVAKSLAE